MDCGKRRYAHEEFTSSKCWRTASFYCEESENCIYFINREWGVDPKAFGFWASITGLKMKTFILSHPALPRFKARCVFFTQNEILAGAEAKCLKWMINLQFIWIYSFMLLCLKIASEMHICKDCATPLSWILQIIRVVDKRFFLFRGWSGHSLWQTATFLAVEILLVENHIVLNSCSAKTLS